LDIKSSSILDVLEGTFFFVPSEHLPPSGVGVPGLHVSVSSTAMDVP
jgi:hypothetical protein